MKIRPETPQDYQKIHDLTAAAFAPMGFSDGTEAALVGQLRDKGALTLSLVVEEDGALIGHVAFSPVNIDGATGDWFGLGPISVRADRQRQGVGRAMVEAGLQILSDREAAGCALTGNPNTYSRMGFVSDGNLHHKGTKDKYVQWRSLDGSKPAGWLVFDTAFGA